MKREPASRPSSIATLTAPDLELINELMDAEPVLVECTEDGKAVFFFEEDCEEGE